MPLESLTRRVAPTELHRPVLALAVEHGIRRQLDLCDWRRRTEFTYPVGKGHAEGDRRGSGLGVQHVRIGPVATDDRADAG